MTPKEKAVDLVDKFYNEVLIDNYESKRCAMICVRELLKNDYNERSFVYEDKEGIHYTLYSVYWADVLIEISKL
jgi:hypothetical protein